MEGNSQYNFMGNIQFLRKIFKIEKSTNNMIIWQWMGPQTCHIHLIVKSQFHLCIGILSPLSNTFMRKHVKLWGSFSFMWKGPVVTETSSKTYGILGFPPPQFSKYCTYCGIHFLSHWTPGLIKAILMTAVLKYLRLWQSCVIVLYCPNKSVITASQVSEQTAPRDDLTRHKNTFHFITSATRPERWEDV